MTESRRFKIIHGKFTPAQRKRFEEGRQWAEAHKDQIIAEAKAHLRTVAHAVAALKQARTEREISLGEVARRSGIDVSYLSKLEGQKYPNPTLETLVRIARAIGVELVIDVRNAAA